MGKKITPPPEELAQALAVLGTNDEEKRIEVDLTTQTLRAYEGSTLVYTFLVSTGKWGATPTGEFRIWIKLRYTRMAGGNPAIGTYYNLPNVPYTMYFANAQIPKAQGFGLHGAYWHNNFGHPMSHGCVNMRPEDAGVIYNWAAPPTASGVTYASAKTPGTRIIITGTAPRE
jgi:lipoprotein-anchoring transpeptidase ErfK/SrfK